MSKVRVLVVDDDPWILRMVSASLEKKGDYQVETARDGQQALQLVHASPPDMIITDVMMPVMDGWTFVQHIRQDPKLAKIPVLFLTALGKDEQRLHALGLRRGDYVSKPFRFDDLERAVAQALGGGGHAEPSHPTPAAGFGPGAYSSTPAPGGFGQAPQYPQQPGYGNPYANPYAQPPAQPPYGQPYGQPAPGPYPYPPQQPYPPQGYPPQPYPPPQGQPYPYPPAQVPPGFPAQAPATPQQPARGDASTSGQYPATNPDARRARRNTGLNGRLEQLGLSSLLVMMEMERKDGVLALSNGEDERIGRIFLRKGQVVHAKLDDEDTGPRECVYEMLRWQKGKFSFGTMEVDMEDTVHTSTTSLLMEGARLIDESNR